MRAIKITVFSVFTFAIFVTVSFRVISSIFPYCTRKSIICAPSVTFSFPLSGSAVTAVPTVEDADVDVNDIVFVIDGNFAVAFDDSRVSGIGDVTELDVTTVVIDAAHSNDTLELVTNVACRFSIGAGIFQEPAVKKKQKN